MSPVKNGPLPILIGSLFRGDGEKKKKKKSTCLEERRSHLPHPTDMMRGLEASPRYKFYQRSDREERRLGQCGKEQRYPREELRDV